MGAWMIVLACQRRWRSPYLHARSLLLLMAFSTAMRSASRVTDIGGLPTLRPRLSQAIDDPNEPLSVTTRVNDQPLPVSCRSGYWCI